MPELYIPTTKTFDYDDVMLVPKTGVVKSRSEVDVTAVLGDHQFALPVIPANMSTIVDETTVVWLAERNFFYVMHRFDVDAVQFTKNMHSKGFYSSVSLGIKPGDYETVDRFVAEGVIPEFITVDVAHGDSEEVFRMVSYLKSKLDSFVIAGNIATVEAAIKLADVGADAVKVGVAPGCFAAGTRVLMSDGTYKNIESIEIGDRVINKNGKPVTVKATTSSGLRLVQKYKHVNWYTHSYATKDHRHFGVDLEGLRSEAVKDEGYAKLAVKKKKTAGFPDRKQWLELGDPNLGAFLFPREVSFEMPESFEVDLSQFAQHHSYTKNLKTILKPNYNLGYIFGTFLGDGSAKIPKKAKESGLVGWVFGKDEKFVAEKLQSALLEETGKEIPVKQPAGKNFLRMQLSSTYWARFLHSFGKTADKHLPKELLVDNKNYLQGIYDGLLDSDGHLSGDGRPNFTNTSPNLIELFSILTLILKGAIPNQTEHSKKETAGGGLLNVNVENCKQSYRTTLNRSYTSRFADDYYCVKMVEKPEDYAVVETYDIEVDDSTHSFIANNVIVHNSVCLTGPNTGFGSRGWQLSALAHVAEALEETGVKIIADGGIRKYGDIAKSVAFGADFIMIGGMFAGHDENPGELIEFEDGPKKAFFGSASEHQKGEEKHVEGMKTYVPYKGSLSNTLRIIRENLQSSVSYAGGRELLDLRDVQYVLL